MTEESHMPDRIAPESNMQGVVSSRCAHIKQKLFTFRHCDRRPEQRAHGDMEKELQQIVSTFPSQGQTKSRTSDGDWRKGIRFCPVPGQPNCQSRMKLSPSPLAKLANPYPWICLPLYLPAPHTSNLAVVALSFAPLLLCLS